MLSVTIIVRNEEANLRRLLPQLGFADEVVVVDTGSTDGTVQAARSLGAKVYFTQWRNDFSAARNYAISRAKGNWVLWLDADDTLPAVTRQLLSAWKTQTPTADFYYMRYRMQGDFPFWFWRERLVRKCRQCRFAGFIHEAIVPFGRVGFLDGEVVHCPSATHEARNLAIYRQQIATGKRLRLRDRYYLARTLLENGLANEAVPLLRKLAPNNRLPVADRVEIYKLLAKTAPSSRLALAYLSRSTRLAPPSGEVCCLFGQVYFERGDWLTAAHWYRLALAAQTQQGFVNAYYTDFLPHVQLSVCLWHLGDISAARRHHLAAKAVAPQNDIVVANNKFFSS